jgi:hypothetical protein
VKSRLSSASICCGLISEEKTLQQLPVQEAQLDDFDVDAVLECPENVLTHAA